MAKKKCKSCHNTKGLYLFYKNNCTKDKREVECKECQKSRSSNSYHAKYKINKPKRRRQGLYGKYGITIEQYDAMLKEQNGVCAICGRKEKAKYKDGSVQRLSIDHCHKTTKIRGLLCRTCNMAISVFDDDIDVLASAISYLINSKIRKAV